jgi:hypothetical protein
MMYLGDFPDDQILRFAFSTRGAGGASITFAGTPSLAVYKDDSDTQSTAGITLTVDRDAVTGQHLVEVNLSSDPFYSAGSDYSITVISGTVDGVDVVGQVLANFSIQNRHMRGTDDAATASALATAQNGLAAIQGAVVALHDLDAEGVRAAIGMADADLDAQLASLATAASLSALHDLSTSDVGDAVLDEVVEGTWTLRQLLRIVAAALAGKLSGAATDTVTIRDLDDSKDRITATVDQDGNRTAVALDAS